MHAQTGVRYSYVGVFPPGEKPAQHVLRIITTAIKEENVQSVAP